MIEIPSLTVKIIDTCNVKCKYCSHFSDLLTNDNPLSLEELELWYHTWHTRVRPTRLSITGGEPLLYKELDDIMRLSRRYFPASDLRLWTNGYLLPKLSPETFLVMKETKTCVMLSIPSAEERFIAARDIGVSLLRKAHIPCEVRPIYKWGWIKPYQLEQNTIKPYHANPDLAWKHCWLHNNNRVLMDNKIYKCPRIAFFLDALRKGILRKEEWSFLEDYQPLTVDATAEEIQKFLEEKPVPACCLCPESPVYTKEKIH